MLTPTVTPMPHAGASPYAPTTDARVTYAATVLVAALTMPTDPDLDRCIVADARYL